MIKVKRHNEITVYKMGRTLGPYVPYVTHAFQIGHTLIDTGTRYAESEFLGSITDSVDTIVNTHHHEDHIGNNRAIQDRFNCAIFAHPLAIGHIADPATIALKPYQKAVWGRPRPSHPEPAGESIEIEGRVFQVIHCTGHCEDHICLYEPSKKWLFAGDMFCGIKNIYLRKDETFSKQVESLRRLARLDVDVIFCAMKGVISERKNAFSEKLAFMETLRDQVLNLADKGKSNKEIAAELLGREDMMWAITLGHFSKKNLVDSILE